MIKSNEESLESSNVLWIFYMEVTDNFKRKEKTHQSTFGEGIKRKELTLPI